MSSDPAMRLTNVNRRRFIGAVATASVVGIAGCSGEGDTDEPADESESTPEETDTPEPEDTETETETEEPTSECTGDTSDCTEEFAQTVSSEIEDSGDTPEPIEAGLYIESEDETVPTKAALTAAFDLTNQSTFGRQLGNLVYESIYENWTDYPETEEFYIGVFPTTDAEDRRTVVHVKKWWIDGLRDGDITVDEVTDNVLDTSTEPLNEVVN